jgi:peptidoglycan/LPS O-acetylase OafA/YrhL
MEIRKLEEKRRVCPESSMRTNWIDAARLFLALSVIFSHSYPLTGFVNDPLMDLTAGQLSFGAVGVSVFFIFSGFLIVKSWLNCDNMREYFQRRVLRIHPGFIVAMMVSMVLAACSSASVRQFWRELPHKEFFTSLFTLHFGSLENLSSTFPGNPWPGVNGSLWTIPIEFAAYTMVAVYGLFALYRFRWVAVALLFAILANYERKALFGKNPNSDWGLSCLFAFGAAFYIFRDIIPRSRMLMIGCLVVMGLGSLKSPWLNVVYPIAMPYVVFYFAMREVYPILAWTKKMDLSYGTYLYAFVVQQSLVYWLRIRNPWVLFVAASIATLPLAALSWFLVEKPCLRLKRHPFQDRDEASQTPPDIQARKIERVPVLG